MATGGGAWASETFDNGRSDFQKPERNQATMEASGTPPSIYNPPAGKSRESNMWGVLALGLRLAQIVFTLTAFAVMAADNETTEGTEQVFGELYNVSDTVKFSAVKAFVGVVAVNSIVCFYAIVQLVVCFVSLATKGSLVSSATTGFAILTFVFDTVLAYALMGAAAAGADSSALLQRFSYCDSFNKFCQQGAAAVAMSFVGFIFLAASGFLYVVRLLMLRN